MRPFALARPGVFAAALAGAALVGFADPLRAQDQRAPEQRTTAGTDSVAAMPHPAPRLAAEKTLELGYQVYLGGLNAFAFTVDIAVNGDNYWLSGAGESQGLLKLMWRWSAALSAGGAVGPDGVDPQVYNVQTISRRGDKRLQVAFGDNGDYAITRNPPDDEYRKSKRELPDSVPATTTDPLTLSLRIARAVANGGGCAGTYHIFDGDRRYDLMFTDLGREVLETTPYSVFAGPATRCRFDMKRIMGFKKKRENLRYWDEENLDPPEVWLARVVPDMPPVPVRLHGDLSMGGLRIYLVWAEYVGKPVYSDGERPEVRKMSAP